MKVEHHQSYARNNWWQTLNLYITFHSKKKLIWCLIFEVEVNLWPTVSRPVCPGVRRPSGTCDQFFFLLEISFRQLRLCYFVAPSLTRGQVCNLLYNCVWTLPEQSLLGRSPAELTAIFYSLLRLPQPGGPDSHIYIPQQQGDPVIAPGTGYQAISNSVIATCVIVWFWLYHVVICNL
jgi:hypothetical protein